MKKKVALLLVLAMLVSMIPATAVQANVATVGGTIEGYRAANDGNIDGVGQLTVPYRISITVPLSALHGRSRPLSTLTPAEQGTFGFPLQQNGGNWHVTRLAVELENAVVLPSDLRGRDALEDNTGRRFWDGELVTPGANRQGETGSNPNAFFQGRRHLAATYSRPANELNPPTWPQFLEVYRNVDQTDTLVLHPTPVRITDENGELNAVAGGPTGSNIGTAVGMVYPRSIAETNPLWGLIVVSDGTLTDFDNMFGNYNSFNVSELPDAVRLALGASSNSGTVSSYITWPTTTVGGVTTRIPAIAAEERVRVSGEQAPPFAPIPNADVQGRAITELRRISPPGTEISPVDPDDVTGASATPQGAAFAVPTADVIVGSPPGSNSVNAAVFVTAASIGGTNPHDDNSFSPWNDPRVSQVQIAIITGEAIDHNFNGNLTIELPVRSQLNGNAWQNAAITVRRFMMGADALDAVPLVNRHRIAGVAVRNVTWEVPVGPRGFSSALHVPALRINESAFGTLHNPVGDMTVMLTAPPFYTWSFAQPEQINRSDQNDRLSSAASPLGWRTTPVTGDSVTQFQQGRSGLNAPLQIVAGGIGGGLSFVYPIGAVGVMHPSNELRIGVSDVWGQRIEQQGVQHFVSGRHRMWIALEAFERNDSWNLGSGWLEIRNLWLVPDDHAPNTGEINVNAAIGRMATRSNTISDGRTERQVVPVGSPFPGNIIFPGHVTHNAPDTETDDTVLDRNRFWDPSENSGAGGWVRRAHNTPVPIQPGVTVNSSSGPMEIVVQLYDFNRPLNYSEPGRLGTGRGGILVVNDGQTANLHVGNRGVSGLSIEVHDGPAEMRTGTLSGLEGINHPTWESWNENRDNEGAAFFRGVQTATLLVSENIPGGFVTGFGAPINFEFLDDAGNVHPGIRILGMQARAGTNRGTVWSPGSFNDFVAGSVSVAGPGALMPGGVPVGGVNAQNSNQNWMTFRGWVGALNQRLPNVPGVGRISELGATVYLPTQAITDVNPIATNLGNGILEIRFFLSIEAGYEWKYGEDINVTVSGAGVANLPGGSYTTTIGLARDPITLTLDSGSTAIETGTIYNIPGIQPVSDVVIDINDNGAVPVGAEIWMYIGTDTIGRNFDVNLVNIPSVTVNAESGLRIDSGRLMAPATAGHLGRAGVVFTVTRGPYGGDAPNPVLHISNINVEGVAMPDIEYQLIVSGTQIAPNDQEVFNATRIAQGQANIAEAAVMPGMNRGVFTSLPYNDTILETVVGGAWDHAPDLTPPQPPAPQLPPPALGTTEFRMWAGMGPIAGVDDPFRWTDLTSTRLRIGEVSARAFGFFINGVVDQGVQWDEATNTATISGEDVHGNNVVVTLTVGSNFATVNGATVDIATFAGQSGPANSITVRPDPATGRIFLPLRFLANAFGRTVELQGEVVVFR